MKTLDGNTLDKRENLFCVLSQLFFQLELSMKK